MATLNSPGDSGAVESVSISATNLSIDAANIQAEVDPSSLAGLFLSVNADDGLQVDVSDGLRNDGTNAISVDASTITEGVLSEGVAQSLLKGCYIKAYATKAVEWLFYQRL